MPMPEELKVKLAEFHKKKRSANPKPGDYKTEDWMVACDWAKDGHESKSVSEGYLKYFPVETVKLLSELLGSRDHKVWAGPHNSGRVVKVFKMSLLVPVFNFLKLPFFKYTRLVACQV